jgi:hypothetical protein
LFRPRLDETQNLGLKGKWCFLHLVTVSTESCALCDARPQHEVGYLVEALSQLDKRVNESWKVLTIFAGTDDLCSACRDPDTFSPDEWCASDARLLYTTAGHFACMADIDRVVVAPDM